MSTEINNLPTSFPMHYPNEWFNYCNKNPKNFIDIIGAFNNHPIPQNNKIKCECIKSIVSNNSKNLLSKDQYRLMMTELYSTCIKK